jgi:dihydroflavonol-4-reductase
MRYFVTGATGLLGPYLVEQLVDAGHEVVALTRSRENARDLPDPVEVVEGDITDKESMREAMTGVDGVFHAAAWFYIGPGAREAERAERVNVEGTRNVLELMDELDVPKGVYTSTVVTYPGSTTEFLDESHTPECPTYSVYARTKWEAHHEVARPMLEAGLPLVVVLPGGIFGPGDKETGSGRGVITNYLSGDLPMIPSRFAIPVDHAEDIARAHVLAMERGVPGEEYIVASEPRTLEDLYDLAERVAGIPGPRTAPPALFGLMSGVMRVAERLVPPIPGMEAESLSLFAGRTFHFDTTKARTELGFEPRPLEEWFPRYVAWEMEQRGMEPVEDPSAQSPERPTA